MDVSKELNQIDGDNEKVMPLINSLTKEREELDKKIHLFKVIHIVNGITTLLDSSELAKDDISSIKMGHRFEDDGVFYISFLCYDKNGRVVKDINWLGEQVQSLIKLEELFQILTGFNSDYVNENYPPNTVEKVILKPGCEEDFLKLLLSTELKTALNYSDLKRDMPQKTEVKNKPYKV
jgi:hypothetical protein